MARPDIETARGRSDREAFVAVLDPGGTVYGQFHDAVDALAGAALAAVALIAGRGAGYHLPLTVPAHDTSPHGDPR
jgi:hypothetical protein